MDKLVVKELIQDELNTKNLALELHELLSNEEKQAQIRNDYQTLRNLLSKAGHASAQAAKIIYENTAIQTF